MNANTSRCMVYLLNFIKCPVKSENDFFNIRINISVVSSYWSLVLPFKHANFKGHSVTFLVWMSHQKKWWNLWQEWGDALTLIEISMHLNYWVQPWKYLLHGGNQRSFPFCCWVPRKESLLDFDKVLSG